MQGGLGVNSHSNAFGNVTDVGATFQSVITITLKLEGDGASGGNPHAPPAYESAVKGVSLPGSLVTVDVGAEAVLANCRPTVKIWAMEAGMFGLPKAVAVKCSAHTTIAEIQAHLQAFAQAACEEAGRGLSGQMNNGFGATSSTSVRWNFQLQQLMFEGELLVGQAAVGSVLSDGAVMQGKGALHQTVVTAQQNAMGACCSIL